MEQWAILALAVVGGLLAVSLLKTILGSLLRYVLFVGMAAAIMKWQDPTVTGFDFVKDLDKLQDLAFIGGIGFFVTMTIMTLFFRKSRAAFLLYPIFGFAATFAANAAWPQIQSLWQG